MFLIIIMSKILIIGPAGTGKTHRLLDDFEQTLRNAAHPLDNDFFFILPSAEHTERIVSVMLQRGLKGFFHRRITTLSRLIESVFGIGHEQVASSVTRFLILRGLFEKHAFEYFREIQQSPGFIQLMLSFIDELKESLISTAHFRDRMNALKQLEPDLALKYEALARIYELYAEELSSQGLRDRQDALALYRGLQKEGKIHLPKFKKIWIDGFFDFSNLQLQYLGDLTELAGEVTVTLTEDNRLERRDLFERIHRTEAFLAARGFKTQWIQGPNRRAQSHMLKEVERNLFVSRVSKKFQGGEDLKIFEAVGMEGEVEMIAREIETLIRTGGYRFSDFAVLLRRVGPYSGIIRSVFDRYEIPAELHEREKLQLSPAIQVVVSLFRIFREGWKREDLVSFLKSAYVRKTGGLGDDGEWVNELENWALYHGISAGREEWLDGCQRPGGFAVGDDFYLKKEQGLKLLADFEEELRRAGAFPQFKQILFGRLYKDFGFFEMPDSLESFVRRDAASFKRLEALADEIGAYFSTHPQAEFHLEAFTDRFFHLVELDLYSLHDRDKNRVQIYDVSLARQKEYRVVFVAGLLEKEFPLQVKEDPVLSDWERELFQGVDETPQLRQRLERQNLERYLFYLAVTRASERIYLTYPRLDLEGQEALPSYYVDEVAALFKEPLEVRKQELARPYPAMGEALDEREFETVLMAELWNPLRGDECEDEFLLYLTEAWLGRKQGERIRKAFFVRENGIHDPRILGGDFFHASKTSATKLEEYAKCPYRYFANRVLGLKDPEETINVMRKGSILHEVLDKFFSYWKDHGMEMNEPVKIKERIARELEAALVEYPLVFEKKYRLELDRAELGEYLERFILQEIERLESSPLKPVYLELGFGPKSSDTYPMFVLDDEGRKISISGKIDRVDADAGRQYGLVMDYKRTAHFKKDDLELGTALQLPVYLAVIEKYLKLKPIGGELYSVRDREKKGFYGEEGIPLFKHASKRRSYLSEKEFREVLNRSLDFVKQFTREMAQARIAVKPRFCDPYCPYPSVCRIEKWRLPQILEEIKEEDRKNKISESKSPCS